MLHLAAKRNLKHILKVYDVHIKWKKSNPNLFKKYIAIYKELMEHPKTDIGHPEALKGGGNITWSRHITAHDRIIYDIYEDIVEVYVLELEGHYSDK